MAICSDGAASMIGKHSEVARVRELIANIIQTHCMIHREAPLTKHSGQSMSEALPSWVKVVSSIKTRRFQSQLFSQLCNKLGPKHSNVLLYTEVRWLSRGKVVERVFELQEEVLLFLQARNTDSALLVSVEIWLGKLAYLADISNLLNGLNLSLQGRDTNFLISQNKTVAFTKKLQIWKNRINSNALDMFPVLNDDNANKPLINTI